MRIGDERPAGDHGTPAGEIGVGETLTHRSIVDSVFTAGIERHDRRRGPCRPSTRGSKAPHSGPASTRFVLDPRDAVGTGFLLR